MNATALPQVEDSGLHPNVPKRGQSLFCRGILAVVVWTTCLTAVSVPDLAVAQGVPLPRVEPRQVLYNAVYFDASDSILHVEIVRDITGRTLEGVGGKTLPKAALCGSDTITDCQWDRAASPKPMNPQAVYAVYMGTDYLVTNPSQVILEKALAVEDVRGKFRILEVLEKVGNAACFAPKCCLCGTILNCCACVTCPRP